MCLRQQQTPSCLKHKAQQNTAEQHSWIHTSGLEVKGLLSHLDASCSLPLRVCGAGLPLPGVETICMMLKLIATVKCTRSSILLFREKLICNICK